MTAQAGNLEKRRGSVGTVTPRSPIRAIPQSGPLVREWELLYDSVPRFRNRGPGFPIARYFGIGAKGAEFPLFTSSFSPMFFTPPHLIF
jgi:hypothetical protein